MPNAPESNATPIRGSVAMHRTITRVVTACWLAGATPVALSSQEIPPDEYAARRRAEMARLPDGILLLHARSAAKAQEQPGFIQDASFLYFSGLANVGAAILAIDAPRHQSLLFVPPTPTSFGFPIEGLIADASALARRHGIEIVQSWDSLAPYLARRSREGTSRFYVEAPRRPDQSSTPGTMGPITGEMTLWRERLALAFPSATIASAQDVIRSMRWVKSPGEVALLRANARVTATALLAGIRRIRPGATQRQAEAAVVSACFDGGAEGPSFWPWIMSGPNAHVGRLVRSDFDYDALDRVMRDGETVRVDIGCGGHSYGADVGRTVPVSGRFDAGQRETWDLLIGAYQAGMAHIRAGVTIADVMATSRAELVRRRPTLTTALGRQAADVLLADGGMALWSIHGVGIDSGETPLPMLVDGAVIAFEPMFAAGKDAFYLEDTILVTKTGHEVLSAGLPYVAREIEAAMAGRK